MQESRAGVVEERPSERTREALDRRQDYVGGEGLIRTEGPGMSGLARGSSRLSRGAFWGAGLGFVVGLIPLLVSTIAFAIGGALIAKASEMRIEPGSAPRIRFGPEKAREQT